MQGILEVHNKISTLAVVFGRETLHKEP